MERINAALQAMGLNEKQSQVYISVLSLGDSLVHEIARSTSLNRTSTYDILEALEHQGIVTHTLSSGKRRYRAIPPKRLLSLLKQKEQLVRGVIPSLEELHGSVTRTPNVEVHVGVNGIKTLFGDILSNATAFDTIASKKLLVRLFKYVFPGFVRERVRRGIKMRAIVDSVPIDRSSPYRVINKAIKTAMWIYNDRIIMISLEEREPVGILVKDRNFYETHRLLFDALWESLPARKPSKGTGRKESLRKIAHLPSRGCQVRADTFGEFELGHRFLRF